MTTEPSAALRTYADQILIGTGLTGTHAEAAANGTLPEAPPHAATAAAALREGWTTATHSSQGIS